MQSKYALSFNKSFIYVLKIETSMTCLLSISISRQNVKNRNVSFDLQTCIYLRLVFLQNSYTYRKTLFIYKKFIIA